MKKRILVMSLLAVMFAMDAYAQNIKTYKARRNDTIEKIANKYGVSPDVLLYYNAAYKDKKISRGDILIIPERGATIPMPTVTSDQKVQKLDFTDAQFIEHTVLPKETKYGISRRYGITQDDLTRCNPVLQTLGVQIGMVLKIPVLTPEQKQQSTQNIAIEESVAISGVEYIEHTVLPKETKYGISRRYGITEEQLCAMNPLLRNDGPKIGQVLRIPQIPASEDDVTSDSLQVDTLAIDTLPKGKYSHLRPVNIDVMLPFYASRPDTLDYLPVKERLKDSRIALSFYSGVLMALDSLGKDALQMRVRVFDTEKSNVRVSSVITENNFSDTDIIIGPLFAEIAEFTSNSLVTSPALVVSPLSMRHDVEHHPHLVQSTSPYPVAREAMLDYMVDNLKSSTKILLLTTPSTADEANHIKTRLSSRVGFSAITSIDISVAGSVDLVAEKLLAGVTTVVAPTIGVDVMNAVSAAMDAISEAEEVTLPRVVVYGIEADARGKRAMVTMSGSKAPMMTFVYATRYFEDKNHAGYKDFVRAYHSRFHEMPTMYAVQGFDVTFDMVHRMMKNIESATNIETTKGEGIASRFTYKKHSAGGYENTAVYIVSYKKSEGEVLLQ